MEENAHEDASTPAAAVVDGHDVTNGNNEYVSSSSPGVQAQASTDESAPSISNRLVSLPDEGGVESVLLQSPSSGSLHAQADVNDNGQTPDSATANLEVTDQTRELTGMPTLREISRKIDGLTRKVDELSSKVDALKYPIPPPPPPPPAPVQHQGNKQGAAGRKEEETTNASDTSSSNSEQKKAPPKLDVTTELRQVLQSGEPILKKRQRRRTPEEANGEENQTCAADESQEEKELKAKLAVRRRLSETNIDTEESKPEVDEPEDPQPSTPTLQLVTEEPKEEEG